MKRLFDPFASTDDKPDPMNDEMKQVTLREVKKVV